MLKSIYFVPVIIVLLLAALIASGESHPSTSKPEAKPVAQTARPSLGAAAARRNENVQVNRIDNDALKEANIRLGDNVTIIAQPPVEANYYATEHGRPPGEQVVLRSSPLLTAWHGELFEYLQNSVFNARTFFQVGPVLPSRQNSYGGRFNRNLKKLGSVTGAFTQRKIRGMVNGNVLVPLESERTPLAADPAVRAVVAHFLAAYPAILPNRRDFDPRALNTNSLQRIDQIDGNLRLDRAAGAKGRLSLFDGITRQTIHAFQLVAGQNPDTEIHTHRSRITYRYALSPDTELVVGAAFNRVRSMLRSEPNAVGPRVRIGYQIEELGPDSQFPIDRAINSFRWELMGTHQSNGARHTLTFGGDVSRYQLNGIETNNQRGVIWFTSNFGRTAIENLRMGAPTTYEVTIGPMDRGFRNMDADFFFADQWKLNPRLQIYYGLRYNLVTAPHEVNGLNEIPYHCDCNNFSPRFSIVYRLRGNWIIRTSYTVSFGQILPVTYQQVRYNLPHARYIQVQNPDLLHPLKDINLADTNGRSTPTILSPDLVSPYAYQYNFGFERRFAEQYTFRAGYVGSRSFKLLNSYVQNRAVPVAGIPPTTETVDQRRPDLRFYEIKYIVNGGIAYMDAAQLSMQASYRRGFVWSATYTFGKAIDQGADYAATAANGDLARGRAQSQYESFKDKKGLSNFDSTHSALISYSYDLPHPAGVHGPLRWFGDGWQISGSTLLKTGTPLTLYIGSDAPGYGNVDGSPSERPNILDPSILGRTISNPNTAPLILSRDRFAYITPGELRGNLGRNTFRKGGIANFNMGLTKQWRWGGSQERAMLLRAEAFNLTNHPQFDGPQRNLSSPAFGKITNTLNDGRVLQLGLRFIL